MTFKEASEFTMPFGKFKGKTLDSIASDDDGLRYLEWLYGEREGQASKLDGALDIYLSDPDIEGEMQRGAQHG